MVQESQSRGNIATGVMENQTIGIILANMWRIYMGLIVKALLEHGMIINPLMIPSEDMLQSTAVCLMTHQLMFRLPKK